MPTPPSSATTQTPSSTPPRTGPLTTGPAVRPGEKPPTLPPFGKTHDSGGAVTFAQFYVTALDWSYATSDPYLLKQVSAPSCVECNKVIDGLTKLNAEGGHIQGSRITINSIGMFDGTGNLKADYIVKTVTTQDAGAIVHANGTTTDRSGRHRTTTYVYLSWISGGWKILGDLL